MGRGKRPIDRAMDVFVFAPLGLLVSARELVPTLAEKGREALTNARAMGEFALGMGQEEAGKVVRNLFPNDRQPSRRASASPPTFSPSAAQPARTFPAAPPEVTIAIPGYDALSASQVVPRLEGLDARELEAVRAYEESGRGRKTVLSRIAQLQAG
jgi:hypothetical protein